MIPLTSFIMTFGFDLWTVALRSDDIFQSQNEPINRSNTANKHILPNSVGLMLKFNTLWNDSLDNSSFIIL